MDELREIVTIGITGVFLLLLLVDCVDDLFLGNHWAGVPAELYGLVGAILAGLYGAKLVRRNGDGKEGRND